MNRAGRATLILACALALLLPSVADAGRRRSTFERITKARTPVLLHVIPETAMTGPEKAMVASLQGIVARTSPQQIYIDLQAGGYPTWLQDLETTHGLSRNDVTDPWFLVDEFSNLVLGYLLYQDGNDSINAATSLAGVESAIIVEQALESQAIAHGLTLTHDLRTRDEAWVKANHGSRLNPFAVCEQVEGLDHQLRDYAVLSKALTFYDGNSSFRDQVIDDLATDSVAYGWGDATLGEDVFVGASSDRGVFTVAADHAHNLAPLSGMPTVQQTQSARFTPAVESGVHYASFLMSDGDNVQYLLGNFQSDPAWFASAERGNFSMGYGMPPSMAELAPSVMSWYYANAANGPGHDAFTVGPSGGGYLYPSRYPTSALQTHLSRLGIWMGLADLRVVQILDHDSLTNVPLWDIYTARPEVHGLVYLEYSDYSKGAGAVVWSNGKPVVSPRIKLWQGLPNSDIPTIISTLNAGARDVTSPQGYSMVSVAVWAHSLDDVRSIVDGLAPDVRVVTPEALVELMDANVPHGRAVAHDYIGADFQTTEMALTGSAFWATDLDPLFDPHPDRLRLTNNGGGQFGSAWHTGKLEPSQSWTSTYRFQITYPVSGGADGLGFHIQGDGTAANVSHEGLGFVNPHLTVAIDTWDNGEGTDESLKVILNGTQIFINDLLDFGPDPNPGSSATVFRMELSYVAADQRLFIRLFDEGGSDVLYNDVSVDLSSFGPAWAGFSALTGGSAENHDVRTWHFAGAASP